MREGICIRKATLADSVFLAEAIIQADMSGGTIGSYCGVFGLTKDEFQSILIQMLDEELEGTELSPLHFLIAEVDGKNAAAVSAWIEGDCGMSSQMVRANLFYALMPKTAQQHAMGLKAIADSMVLHRTQKFLQLESIYTDPAFRGRGLAPLLMREQARRNFSENRILESAELMTYSGNHHAIAVYERMGFVIANQIKCHDPAVMKYYPSDGMVQMQIPIQQLLIENK